MAGTNEILKAYVTLATDTTQMRAGLTQASADVEAWQRKQRVAVPLIPGMGPGGGGGPVLPGVGPIGSPGNAGFADRLKDSTAGVRGFSNAIQSTLGIGLRFVSWLSLAGLAVGGLGKILNANERAVLDANKAYNTFRRSIEGLRESTLDLTGLEREQIKIREQASAMLAKIREDENLTWRQQQDLIHETKAAEREAVASVTRSDRVRQLNEVQTAFEKTADSVKALTSAPETNLEKITKPFDSLSASIQRSITEAMQADSSLVSEYEAMLERLKTARTAAVQDMLKEQRSAMLDMAKGVFNIFADAGRKFAQIQQEQMAAQAKATVGLFNDMQRTIQSINLQNIEGRLESIGQHVQLLARR